ncbi:MAG: hypothetical protein RLZZ603_1288 [Actinomycetota bacterium]|jgi:hypothetical protein
MASKYKYAENPHIKVRTEHGPATRANLRRRPRTEESAAHRFNSRLGLAITNRVGTMWAAYVFAALALVSLPGAIASGNTVVIIGWVAQTFLQLVLLPIIIVGQNIQAKAADERAIATYNDADAILHDAKEIQAHLDTQDEAIGDLLSKVATLEAKLLAAEGKKK